MNSKIPLLVSYAFTRRSPKFMDLIRGTSGAVDWMIDSGAFSDFANARKAAYRDTEHVMVSLDEYMMWVREHRDVIWNYVALDVPGSKEQTAANLAIMVDAGLRPMPVLVVGEHHELMEDLVKVNQYVCVAGFGYFDQEWALWRTTQCFEASSGVARIHALGYARYPEVCQMPIYSSDASSWMSGGRYGMVMTFNRFLGMRTLGKWGDGPAIDYAMRCGAPLDKASWTGQLGVPCLLTVAAAIREQIVVGKMNRRLFLAMSTRQWIAIVAGVYSVLMSGASDGHVSIAQSGDERLDYRAMRDACNDLLQCGSKSRVHGPRLPVPLMLRDRAGRALERCERPVP